jgi:uncharacterized protein YbcI
MTTEAKSQATGDLNREISRAMVTLFKESTGRGPARVKTYTEENLIVTILHDTMTTAERTLTEDDREETVRDLRRIFQGTFRDDAIAAVERLTDRKVLAFLSDHAVDPDYVIEAFVLEPGIE